ncbi:MAG: hypothetical protein ABI672_01685 [Vicinamibacteria bacterium]
MHGFPFSRRVLSLGLAMACAASCRRSSLADLPLWRVETDGSGQEFRVVQLPYEQASYDMASYAIVRRVLDRNRDGLSDRIITYNGVGASRTEETDTDFDGRVDRWDTFGPDGKRLKSATARVGNRPDRMASYDRAGLLARVETDSDLDGVFDLVQIYEHGKLAESRIDSDNNGRTDRIQDFRPGYLATEDFDTDEDGVADLRMTYARDGSLLKIAVLNAAVTKRSQR